MSHRNLTRALNRPPHHHHHDHDAMTPRSERKSGTKKKKTKRNETNEDFESLQFQQERSLGNGGFGTVMAASLGGVPVVVKKLNNQNVGADLLEDMRRDVQKFHDIQVRERKERTGVGAVRMVGGREGRGGAGGGGRAGGGGGEQGMPGCRGRA